MPLTGLFAIPIGSGQPSPSAAIISHISRSFPAEPLPTFYLDHRLFVDTSGLLPSSNASVRKFTSILTLSHTPATTYVATTSSKGKSQDAEQSSLTSSLITIPSSSADSFTQLIGTKLQPLWTIRQSLIVENGTALSLNNGEWIIRIGDLKVPPRANQAGPNLRSMLVEVAHIENDMDDEIQGSDDGSKEAKASAVKEKEETLLRAFLDSVTDGSGVPSIANPETSRSLIRRTRFHEKDKGTASTPPDLELASLYLDIIRGSRG
jgi:hypothetical protein